MVDRLSSWSHTEDDANTYICLTLITLQELLEAVPGYSPLPTARLLEDYCLSKVVKALPPCLQRIRQDTLERVEPTPYQGTASESDGCLFNSRPDSLFLDACQVSHLPPLSFLFDPGGLTLHLGSGAEVLTRALVVSRVDSRPIIPPWAADLVDREGTAVRSAHRLRLTEEELAGRSVAVVGGGMTSVTLALAAAARGARAVTLVARRWGTFWWWGGCMLVSTRLGCVPASFFIRPYACRMALQVLQASVDYYHLPPTPHPTAYSPHHAPGH